MFYYCLYWIIISITIDEIMEARGVEGRVCDGKEEKESRARVRDVGGESDCDAADAWDEGTRG